MIAPLLMESLPFIYAITLDCTNMVLDMFCSWLGFFIMLMSSIEASRFHEAIVVLLMLY